MDAALTKALIEWLRPLTSRVRTDATALKTPGEPQSKWRHNEPLTDDRLADHLAGKAGRGTAPIKPGESVTCVGLLDFDSHRGESSWSEMVAAAQSVMDLLELDGYPVMPFRSSGGNGIHLVVLWDQPQDAHSVRVMLVNTLAALGYSNGTKGVAQGEIEVFPKSDEVRAGKFGNQFILPLFNNSVPLEPMLGLEPMDKEYALQLTWRFADPVPVVERPVADRVTADDADPIERVRSALFSIPNEQADYEPWFALMCAVHEATGGSEDGFDLFNEWSAQIAEHDERETRKKYDSISAAGSTRNAITRASLYHRAGLHGWSDVAPPDADGFEDVPQADVQRAVAEIRAEKADQKEAKRAALAQATEIAKGITDSVDMRDELVPCLRRLLNTFPELRTESLSLLRTTGKAVGSPLTQADAVHMLVGPRTPTVKAPRPLTEFGNAERMLDKYGSGLMYVPEIDCWYTWTGVYWERTSDVWVEHLAKETVRDLGEEAKDLDSSELGDFFEFCRISQQARMVSNMVKLAKSDPRVLVPAKELDRQSHLLGVENGIVDLRTGKLLPPDPEARITLCAGCKYDPTAKAPVFEQTISDVFFEDQSMVEYVLRTFGYALQGEPTEDIMFIAFGNGANGKSTIFNAVRRAFGGYARSADAASFVSDSKQGGAGGAREDLVRLRGARFVYVNEPDENGELREGVVKSMTGGDAITARGVYAKDSVEIEPTWTVFMPTNHKPIIKGSDNGIWRRMGMLPFERNFETDKVRVKDGKRADKLLAELPGILNLIVRAGLKYRAEGLRAPSKVLAARDSYRAQMDLLAEWLDECCEIGEGHVCEIRNLWVSWETFAKSRGLLNYIRSSTALGRRLDSRFAPTRLNGGVRARIGIRLKAETEFLPG